MEHKYFQKNIIQYFLISKIAYFSGGLNYASQSLVESEPGSGRKNPSLLKDGQTNTPVFSSTNGQTTHWAWIIIVPSMNKLIQLSHAVLYLPTQCSSASCGKYELYIAEIYLYNKISKLSLLNVFKKFFF